MFKIGDMAVYPTQGVGVIEDIESREFSGHTQSFYVLRIVDSDMRIMVPTVNVANVGMRRLIDQKRIIGIFEALAVPGEAGKIASWSRRQREYQDKLKPAICLKLQGYCANFIRSVVTRNSPTGRRRSLSRRASY